MSSCALLLHSESVSSPRSCPAWRNGVVIAPSVSMKHRSPSPSCQPSTSVSVSSAPASVVPYSAAAVPSLSFPAAGSGVDVVFHELLPPPDHVPGKVLLSP